MSLKQKILMCYSLQKLLTRMRVMITGASRGIGSSIAKMFAKKHGEHAKISMLSRSARQPSHHKLEGTLSDTADEISKYGSLPYTQGRSEKGVRSGRGSFKNYAGV